MKNLGEDSLNNGIGWLFIYYDEHGEFTLKRFKGLMKHSGGSKDAEAYTPGPYVIRIYEVISYEGKDEKTVEKVEVYDDGPINTYTLMVEDVPDAQIFSPYFTPLDMSKGNRLELVKNSTDSIQV